MARKRSFTAFNLSFLDVMSCGFGAVVLVFLIIDHAVEVESQEINIDLHSQVNLLEEEILEGESGLVRLRNTLSEVDFEMVDARGLATRIDEEIDTIQQLIQSLEQEGLTERNDAETLEAEVKKLEAELAKLRESADKDPTGDSARAFVGEGNRQYLTGLNLGGRNILILLDSSASMLAPELVNIIRLRNMDEAVRKRAKKWQQAVATVSWLTAQLPAGARYQVYSFNTEATSVLASSDGAWLQVSNQAQLDEVVENVQNLVPSGGTSLENAVLAMLDMSPLPDNIFLITDGLPTQGISKPKQNKVTEIQRIKLFQRAIGQMPSSIPVNVILSPMEGEPMAASLYWKLAVSTAGSFLAPSRDWP